MMILLRNRLSLPVLVPNVNGVPRRLQILVDEVVYPCFTPAFAQKLGFEKTVQLLWRKQGPSRHRFFPAHFVEGEGRIHILDSGLHLIPQRRPVDQEELQSIQMAVHLGDFHCA